MILYCLTNFLYKFDNGKSTLKNSALKFAAEEQALYLIWKQASRHFFCRPIILGDLEKVYCIVNESYSVPQNYLYQTTSALFQPSSNQPINHLL